MQFMSDTASLIEVSFSNCSLFSVGSPRRPSIRSHVRRRRPGLVGPLHDVAASKTDHGQVLCHFCPEPLKVDRTWRRVRYRALSKENAMNYEGEPHHGPKERKHSGAEAKYTGSNYKHAIHFTSYLASGQYCRPLPIYAKA